MRWNDKPSIEVGDRRERNRFLWFPKSISGETRWLEHGQWIEEYYCRVTYEGPPGGAPSLTERTITKWREVSWVEV